MLLHVWLLLLLVHVLLLLLLLWLLPRQAVAHEATERGYRAVALDICINDKLDGLTTLGFL